MISDEHGIQEVEYAGLMYDNISNFPSQIASNIPVLQVLDHSQSLVVDHSELIQVLLVNCLVAVFLPIL